MHTIVGRLNVAKKNKGITLKELSKRSGISLGTVNKIMSGALQKIKPEKLEKLAKALDVSVESLLTAKNDDNFATKQQNLSLGLVKIACISPKVSVGDCDYNSEQIIETAIRAEKDGVSIALYPELCITGYTCGDLFFQSALQNAAVNSLETIAKSLEQYNIAVIVGLPIRSDSGKLYNVGAVVYHGKVLGIVPKINLPNYNEFFEKRLFTPYDGANTTIKLFGYEIPFGNRLIFADTACNELRFSLEICEDVWVSNSPSVMHAKAGANAIFNLSASNETIIKGEYRRKMLEIKSGMCGVIYAYCSSASSESTSQTVFGGHNLICENGVTIGECLPFTTDYAEAVCDFDFIQNERAHLDHQCLPDYLTIMFDLPIAQNKRVYTPTPFVPQNKNELFERSETAFNILTHGLKKRIEHTNAKKLIIGLSGGSDSTLAFLICEKTLRLLNRSASDIIAVTMPCFGTSKRTLNNSIALANAYGATLRQINISKSVTQHLNDIAHDLNDANVTYENAQARERTQVLMDLANDEGGLVIGTGDMSELALGWSTYNGDHMSMYGVNCSVPKTLVKALIKHCANVEKDEKKRNTLLNILDTPISPELLPLDGNKQIAQITENVIGPYELHDYFLFMLIRKNFTPSKVFTLAKWSFANKYTPEEIYKWLRTFIWRFFSQQFKRSCAPDGVKLGSVYLSNLHFRMPSDACCNIWFKDLEKVNPAK